MQIYNISCYNNPKGIENMYDYFKGILTDKRKTAKGTFVSIEVAGVGYLLEVTERDFICVETSDSITTKFYASLIHREDSMSLFGFSNKETRDIFQILLSVSGVGAKMAIALLNEFDACDLISLVINGDFKELTRAKGVGPKLAQKIILELKDKLIKTDLPITTTTLPQNQAVSDAQTIMLSLGYEEKEVETALSRIIATVEDDSNPEEILRKALTCLSM
jgi:Holliday junction DNA helicase RuvA